MAKRGLIEALGATAELCGRELSPAALRMMVDDLARYPEEQVAGALHRCRRDLKGPLTVAAIVSRLDDGRPGADEAWSMVPQDEVRSTVWTTEIAEAFGAALPLMRDRDTTAARFAFREAYTRLVGEAREAGRAVDWLPSLGTDIAGREVALREAVDRGRLTLGYARTIHAELPAPTGAIAGLFGLAGPGGA